MKVKVFIFAFNRPDLLSYQIKCIRTYLKNEHEIYVIHDSRNSEYVSDFSLICDQCNINFYHNNSLPGRSPSDYHSNSVQWAYDNVMMKECKDDFVLILDHDMFLIDEFDVGDYMKGYDAAGCLQQRGKVKYFWTGLTILNMKTVSNIVFDFKNGTYHGELLDTGGGTCNLLNHKTIKYKDTGVEYPDDYQDINLKDPSVSNGFNFELHMDSKFLHSRNASSWHNNMKVEDSHKTSIIHTILRDFIEV